jgi:molybdate transport system permease protein
VSPRLFSIVLGASVFVTACFLGVPLLALFVRTSPGDMVDALRSPAGVDAIWVSLKTSAIAHVFILGFGTPAAYLIGTREFRGRPVAIALVELPLVLPPAVAGIALLSAFGRRGLLGGSLEVAGITIPFTQVAVVLAVAFVAGPFYLRQAIATFAGLDRDLIDASRSLGASASKTFRSVALPLALGGLGAGSGLAWARGLGEFGATIMFAGSLQGITQTMPLAIYAQLDQDLDVAVALGALLVIISAATLLAIRSGPLWERYIPISRSPRAL